MVNLQTAKALGLVLPDLMIVLVDEVIEGLAAIAANVSCWPRLCENSARYNCTWNFEACGHA